MEFINYRKFLLWDKKSKASEMYRDLTYLSHSTGYFYFARFCLMSKISGCEIQPAEISLCGFWDEEFSLSELRPNIKILHMQAINIKKKSQVYEYETA